MVIQRVNRNIGQQMSEHAAITKFTVADIRRLTKRLGNLRFDTIREDGRLERVCEHGVGHTVSHIKRDKLNEEYIWVHGCDGCCREYQKMKS